MSRVPTIFVSSTSHDLLSYRETAARALRDREFHVVVMEHFPPDHRGLNEMLRRKIAPCDAVVCLVGFHYGAEPPVAAGAARKSYTQWEYFIARDLRKPIFLFFATDGTPMDHAPSEDPEPRERQMNFRRSLQESGVRWDLFTTHQALRDLVLRIPMPAPAGRGRPAALVVAALAAISAGALWAVKPWRTDETRPEAASPSAATPTTATVGNPFINSLGMKFVPVPNQARPVLMAIAETRGREWKEAGLASGAVAGPDEPVGGIVPSEAAAFCRWLTQRERAAARLPDGWSYRLPATDEWTAAAAGTTPENTDYPWGNDWPPARPVGNLRGAENSGSSTELPDDGFVGLAPAASFPANSHGFHDLAGNVWEITLAPGGAVLRGGSFQDSGSRRLKIDFTPKAGEDPDRIPLTGFRCVLAPDS